GIGLFAQRTEVPAQKMVAAANAFLTSLQADQKTKAAFPFDSKERTNWHFIPLQDSKTKAYTRKGLPLEEMTAEQKKLALALVAAGTSAAGKEKVETIIGL